VCFDEDGNVVFPRLAKDIVRNRYNARRADDETGFFERLALGAVEERFILVEVAAGEGVLAYSLDVIYEDKSSESFIERVRGGKRGVPVPKALRRWPARTRPSLSLMIAMTATRGWAPVHAMICEVSSSIDKSRVSREI
jgi:hypothetical protein